MIESTDRMLAWAGTLAVCGSLGIGCASRAASTPSPAATRGNASGDPASPSGSGKTSAPAPEKPAIVQIGNPVLRQRAAEVPRERIGTPEFEALVARMIATMRAAPGVGLAAPQIGVSERVIVLEDRDDYITKLTPEERGERERVAFAPRVFVNPKLTLLGADRVTFLEGCLSVRGYVALAPRAREVEVTGLDEHGEPQTWRVRGWPARILQHEVDHLDGTLYVDRMLTRSFVTQEHAKEQFAGKPIATIIDALR